MARVKKSFSMRPQLWLVKMTVSDPGCVFSINPNISFNKIIRATNVNAAVKGAAAYCARKMKEYPDTDFTYSTKEVKPYYYPVRQVHEESSDRACFTKVKY